MRWLWRILAAIVLAVASMGAASAADCRQAALQHLRASPDGLAISRHVDQPGFFASWLRCDDPQYGLPTAVHESTHAITAATDAFPLVGGGAVNRPHEASAFFPPYKIAKGFRADDFVSIYLGRGKASSATDFIDLLDELNAYTHDLATAVDLKDLKANEGSVDHRDGLAATMTFVAVYAETARASEPRTWRGLQAPKVAGTIARLWSQAERVIAASCGIPEFGNVDRRYLRRLCAIAAPSALEDVIGHAPACPAACLTPDAAETSDQLAMTRE